MHWKIIFSEKEKRVLEIHSSTISLDKKQAMHFRKMYAKQNNDGGMVYLHGESDNPIPLTQYIDSLTD